MTASVVLFTAMAVGREYPEHLKLAAKVRAIVRDFVSHEHEREADWR